MKFLFVPGLLICHVENKSCKRAAAPPFGLLSSITSGSWKAGLSNWRGRNMSTGLDQDWINFWWSSMLCVKNLMKQKAEDWLFHAALEMASKLKYHFWCCFQLYFRMIIHDANLRRWALLANRGVGLENFKASVRFIRNFKLKCDIVSRKVTEFVIKSYTAEHGNLEEKARDFVESVLPRLTDPGAVNLYNADQGAIQKQSHTGRTLDVRGCSHARCFK